MLSHSFILLLLPLLSAHASLAWPSLDISVVVPSQSNGHLSARSEAPVLERFDIVVRSETNSSGASTHRRQKRLGKAWGGHASTLASSGSTGIGAMQVSVVDDDHILIYDKSENNPLKDRKGRPTWGAIYTISTQAIRALNVQTNSFCAGGGWLGNGTLVSVGGNPAYADYAWAGNGIGAIRLFTPCDDGACDVYENPSRIRLTSARWYATTARLEDGSIIIFGGMIAGGFNNAEATDNPTLEYFPPKGNGLAIYSKFLHDALNTNLFPIVWLLPNGLLFVAANEMAMFYDRNTNKETRLPGFPNGVKINYPDSPASVLLPLTIANSYTPEALICGGSTANSDGRAYAISAAYGASTQCVRMVLTTAGAKKGWAVEQMPTPRVMGDAVLMPDGTVFIINGAVNGIAGYGNVRNEVGRSNAKTPNYKPVLYDPLAKSGSRFTTNFPASKIERLYHSSATLVPDGRVMVSGSNPNDDVSTQTYMTRYESEMFSPPYVYLPRPTYSSRHTNIMHGKWYVISIAVPANTKVVTASILDLGYSTHGVHMNNRLVELQVRRTSSKVLKFQAPINTGVYPPGYGWLFVLADGVPSKGTRVMVGDGSSPPVSQSAINNMLKHTSQQT